MGNDLFFVLALYGVAIGLSALILRVFPTASRAVAGDVAGRFASIDGLRGLLAFGVFIHHGVISWNWMHTGQWSLPEDRLFIHLGQSSVALFFMVTSFLFWSKILDARAPTDWFGFALARAYRLYPVYLLAWVGAVLLAFAATGFTPAVDGATLARSLLGWATFKTPPVNGMENAGQIVAYATWSLKYELLFYSALPALAFLFARSRRPAAVAASLAATLAVFLYFRGFSPAIVACFSGGFAAAHWIRHPALAALGRSRLGGAVALAALVGTVAGFNTAYAPLPILGLGVVFTAVASGQGFGPLLTVRPIRWLGAISYGVYVLHGLVLWVVITGNPVLSVAVQGNANLYAILLAVTGGLVVALASLVHLAVERPAIALGHRHARRLRGLAARAVPLQADL